MLTSVHSYTKSMLNKSLGNLSSFHQTANGIQGETDYGRFEVSLYSNAIFRIKATLNEAFDDFSFAVNVSPEFYDFSVEDLSDQIVISTNQAVLKVQKNPVRFSFYSKDGRVVNEDDEGFGISWIGDQVTTYKKLQKDERFIGLGEKTGPLDRKGNGYQNWNTDSFAYGTGADPLYCTTPFYIGLHNELSYGIFFDNSHKTHFNFGASNNRFSSFSADFGDMDYYFIHNDNVADTIASYTYLTGRMELPPVWSIGYQQCRYSYYPDKEVLTLANTFRDKDIPADVIVMDIHYMDAYKIFTWDKENFPDPKGMIEQLKEQGFHVVVMCDPGIKIEKSYEAYEDGIQKDIFIKYPDGTYYSGEVWPGWCHFPDFTNPKARAWWESKMNHYVDLGVDGYWNDMNEIATWGQTLPELMEMDFDGNPATARKGRNVYGMQMARSTYEGSKNLLKGKRPFNLTRAGYSGIQRYAAVWTGDNVATDEHMMLGVRLVNSMGLTGIAFAGYDVGGFCGNASEGLFARWVSIGAFSPFFRGHSMINSRDSEPWAYGEEVEEISRNYIKLRYRMMPYLYAAFFEAAQTGMPVSRSLAINYAFDDNIYDGRYENQYLFGDGILVAPVESTKNITKVYLPEGNWYELYTDVKYNGNQEIYADCPIEKLPVYVKGSAIIPMQSATSSFKEKPDTTLEIHLYQGEVDNTFTYYEDDGESYDFEKGDFFKRMISYAAKENTFTLRKKEGNFGTHFKSVKLYMHGFESLPETLKVNGNAVAVQQEDYLFIDPISNFDPLPDIVPENNLKVKDLAYVVFNNEDGQIDIQW